MAQVLAVAADFVLIWVSSVAALGLRLTPAFTSRVGLLPLERGAQLAAHAGFLMLYSVFVVLLCDAQGLYRRLHAVSAWEESRAACKAVLFAAIVQTACIGFSGSRFVSRFVIGFTAAVSAALLAGWRRLRRLRWEKAHTNRWSCRNALIVGSGLAALALRAYLERNPQLGYVVRGLVAGGAEQEAIQAAETLGSVSDLRALARAQFVDEVLVAVADRQVVKRAVSEAANIGLDVRVVPDLYDDLAWGAPVEYLGRFPVIVLHQRPGRAAALVLKRWIDVVVSAAALVVLLPLFLMIAIAIKLDSSGSVIYASERVGRKGSVFPCYKFRTMVANAEALQASVQCLNQRDKVLFKIANDPRVTRLGRFLRKYSLDELPQLWNVLKGDMSLVGPRPPLAGEVQQYELEHLHRLDALPGITGLWQVEARSNPSFARYVSLDIDYVEHWRPWLDIKILLKTIAVVMAKLEELNKQLTAAEANRMLKQTGYQIAKSGDAELISTVGSSNLLGSLAGMNSNPLALIQNLRAQQAELKVQYAQAASKYGSAYPRLIQMRNQLQELEKAIQAEIDKVAARAENDFLAAKNAEDLLRTAFERQKEEANKLNDSAVRYTIMKRDAESSRELYDDLLRKLKEAGVLAGLRSSNLVVVDPARSSAKPVRPSYPINLGLGLGVGILGGIGLAFAREGFDSTIRTTEQVEAVAGLPAVGIIPDLTAGHAWRLRPAHTSTVACNILDAPSSLLAESYRALRTALLYSNGDVSPKVILVTSALPQEGKTTASLNSAIALAYQGAKVLLIDADLRRPELHACLGVPAEPGLGELLADEEVPPVKPSACAKAPNLFLLPAGYRRPSPAEALGSERMRGLLNAFRKRFDFVVIDTPPVLAVTDAVVLAKSADGVLLVVRSAETTEQSLLRARDLLLRVNARIAGVLVNRANIHSSDYYNSYAYLGERFGEQHHGLNH